MSFTSSHTTRLSTDQMNDERISYLMNEVSDLRAIVRYLTSESAGYKQYIDQTAASFDFQWKNLSEGLHLMSDNNFREGSIGLLEKYTGLPRQWFDGKSVLDAGCGNGRWSWTLCNCGARVMAIDASPSGVRATREVCRDFPDFEAGQHNLLDAIGMPEKFDLVYSFGVVHHTGNTRLAIQNIARCVKPGGLIFLMVYGEPRWDVADDFVEVNQYSSLRRKLVSMDFDERVSFLSEQKGSEYVHGWFDAVSPRINDLHRFDEIAEWLHIADFSDVHTTIPSRNLHIVAKKLEAN